MYQGLDLIHRAGTLLQDGHLTPRGRLRQAANLIWTAFFVYRDWPIAIQLQVGVVQRMILRHGPINQTVKFLSDSEVEETLFVLETFVRRFEPHQPTVRSIDGNSTCNAESAA